MIRIEFNGQPFVPRVETLEGAKKLIWMYRGQCGKPEKGNAPTAAQKGKWAAVDVQSGHVIYAIEYGNTNDRTAEAARR